MMSRGRQQQRRALPGRIYIAVFHVRDLEAVKELVRTLHSRPRRKRPGSGARRGRQTTGRAPASEHPPIYLADDNHLVAVAPSRTWATRARRAIERALGDAIDHVETKSIKIPKPPGGGITPRGRR
jgi:hypothetical protein